MLEKIKSNRKIVIIVNTLIVLGLLTILIIPFFFGKTNNIFLPNDRNLFGLFYYIGCFILSIACLYIYIFKHKKVNIWALLAFISVLISIVGYLIIYTSENIVSALIGNRIAYFGNGFLLPFMFMTLANICDIKISKTLEGILFSIAIIMFIFSFSQGYFDLFYTSQSFELVNGFPRIMKEYGPLHTVYLVYIIILTLLIIGLTIFTVHNKKTKSSKCIVSIAIILFVNVILWLSEKFLPYTVEYTVVAFVLTEVAFLFIFRFLEKKGAFSYGTITLSLENEDLEEQKMSITVSDVLLESLPVDEKNDKLFVIDEIDLKNKLDKYFDRAKLTSREKDVAYLLVKGKKRREIAQLLYISDETVKTHIKHIFQKLKVSSHVELKEKAEKKIGNRLNN